MSLRPRHVAAGLAGLAYVIASQWLMTRTPPPPWSAFALLAPMLLVVCVGAWRAGRRFWSVAAAALAAVLAWQALWGGGFPPERLYLLQHLGIHLFLAAVFGVTLRRGAVPLITQLAGRVHATALTPAMRVYTRKVTIAWTLYFLTMAALSAAIYAAAPFSTWATFANLLTPLALVAMFAAEFGLRYRLHPEFERSTIRDAIRAYTQVREPPPAPPTPHP